MSVVASSIINRVRSQLIDTNANNVGYRWSDSELLRYLSDGQRTVVAISNSAGNKVSSVQLVAGTRQTIPSDGHTLLTINRNMGTDGRTPGRAMRLVTREIMDNQNPSWHTDKASAVAFNYLFDPEDQRAFYVYPPSTGTSYVEMNYAVMPADLVNLTDTLVVQDIYQTALLDYVLFRAYQKDSDYGANQQVAANYFNSFTTFMGVANNSQEQESPNLQLFPSNPQTKGTLR